ncbi:MAG: hypothetical protein ACKVK1_01945 [Flavobacteriales bacterium]
MSENIKFTQIQIDYKQHVDNQRDIIDAAGSRITLIRKEIQTLHNEETKLELIRETLQTSQKAT